MDTRGRACFDSGVLCQEIAGAKQSVDATLRQDAFPLTLRRWVRNARHNFLSKSLTAQWRI